MLSHEESETAAWSTPVSLLAVQGRCEEAVIREGLARIEGDASEVAVGPGLRLWVVGASETTGDLPIVIGLPAMGGALGGAPPTATVRTTDVGLEIATDWLGFCHVYIARGATWTAVSTSALALGAMVGRGLDPTALACLSTMGWLVGDRSIMDGVTKLSPGATVRMSPTSADVRQEIPRPARADGSSAPAEAAALLREIVDEFWERYPGALLQLTGGLDSRLMLAATHPARRSSIGALTLRVSGSQDVPIAAMLAERYGFSHRVIGFEGVGNLTPEQAHAEALRAASRLQASSDPIAFASLAIAEGPDVGRIPRLSGLGGEVVRGFYYSTLSRTRTVTNARIDRLASWRLFPNEQVDLAAFEDPASWQAIAKSAVREAFGDYSDEWNTATDDFYLWQRMHRWAGALASATAGSRDIVNPMLDQRFVDLGRGLPCRQKAGARYLSRILVDLDPELAKIPLDGRPAPYRLAHPSVVNTAMVAANLGERASRKALQRVRGTTRPPAGGEVLAKKVLAHYRDNPESLRPVLALELLSERWVDSLLAGEPAGASTVALLVSLEAVSHATAAGVGGTGR